MQGVFLENQNLSGKWTENKAGQVWAVERGGPVLRACGEAGIVNVWPPEDRGSGQISQTKIFTWHTLPFEINLIKTTFIMVFFPHTLAILKGIIK